MNGEYLSAGEVEVILYCNELAYTIFDHSYCMDQIFNAGDISVHYKMLPNKTVAAKVDREAPVAKKFKECVIVLTCANAST